MGLLSRPAMQYTNVMNIASPIRTTGHTVCPHDCPSACALNVDLRRDGRIGRVRWRVRQYLYGRWKICAKVARYAERLYHPDRLLTPKRRKGAKGEGAWQEVSWENALDEIASFVIAEAAHGSEAIWPYFYAGTMGQVQRDSIERLRHAKRYSGFFGSICTNMAWTGYVGNGRFCAALIRVKSPRPIASSSGARMRLRPRSM